VGQVFGDAERYWVGAKFIDSGNRATALYNYPGRCRVCYNYVDTLSLQLVDQRRYALRCEVRKQQIKLSECGST